MLVSPESRQSTTNQNRSKYTHASHYLMFIRRGISIVSQRSDHLSGRTILVTGGSSGIGRSIVDGLMAEGASVAVISRRPLVHWEAGIPVHWSKNCALLSADLRQTEELETSIKEWLDTVGGRLDALVLAAASYGANRRHPLSDTSLAEWDELFDVNIRSQFIIIKLALHALLRSKCPTLIGISSDTAVSPAPGRIGYGCTKASSLSLFAGLAEELRDSNLTIVQLSPKRQICTPGIRKRRPNGFDFTEYDQPDIFALPVVSLIRTPDRSLHGRVLTLG